MTPSPLSGVGPFLTARPDARRWENTPPYVLHGESKRPSAGHDLRRIAPVLLTALVVTVIRHSRRVRWAAPLIHRLVAAEELRFAVLCQQIAHARQGVEQ